MVYRSQPELSEIRNFLLLQYPSTLGAAIRATPLVEALHAAIPGARVSAVASGFALEVLSHHPGLEQCVSGPSPLHGILPAAQAIRRAKVFGRESYAVLLTTGTEPTPVILAALLSGSPTRVGFTLGPELATAHLHYDPRISQIANNLRLIEALGHGSSLLEQLQADPALVEPVVYFSASDLGIARTLLQEANLEQLPTTAFVVQGGGGQGTSWHDSRFAEVVRHVESIGHQTIFLGTESDAAEIDRIRLLSGSTGVSLAGRTTISQLAALLCLCDLLVAPDNGVMQVGRAAGVPIVVLGTSHEGRMEWLPPGDRKVRISQHVDLDNSPEDSFLNEVTAVEVIETIDALQRTFPPSEEERHQRIARSLSIMND